MNRALRRSIERRLGKNKAAFLYHEEPAETSHHPLRYPRNWHDRRKTVVYKSDGLTVTLPGTES